MNETAEQALDVRTLDDIARVLVTLASEVASLHTRLDGYEKTFGAVLAAAKANPMVANMLRANGVKL